MYLFEIHLTVDELTSDKITEFESLCQKLGGKAILIELPMGEHIQQPMMTYVKQANNITEILADIDDLKPKFLNQGFNIIRTKIEIPTDQYDAYIKEFPNTKGYFEWHGKAEFENVNDLIYISKTTQTHLSKNALKNQDNQRFLTIRHYLNNSNQSEFLAHIQDIIKQIENSSVILMKSQSEFCVYDDKIFLDKDWI